MLSLSHKFLFVHIPKTGGNSIQSILHPYSEDKILALPTQDGKERFEVRGPFTPHKHASLADYHSLVPPKLFAELIKFCAVRNPWSRAVSFYFSPRRWIDLGIYPSWSRDDFLELLHHLPPMVEYLKIDGQIQPLGEVIKFENLAEQLPAVLRRIGIEIEGTQLPQLNRSLSGDYRTYFEADQDLVDLVAERYREDVEYFGYRFDG